MPYEYTIANLSQKIFVRRHEATVAARGIGCAIYQSPFLKGETEPSTTVAVLSDRGWVLRHWGNDGTGSHDEFRWAEIWRAS